MHKVVYNCDFGGFSVSHKAMLRYCQLKNWPIWPEKGDYGFIDYFRVPPEERGKTLSGAEFYRASLEEREASNAAYDKMHLSTREFARHDPVLVQVVEELGKEANGRSAHLAIEEIAGSLYRIEEYDGAETVWTPENTEWINVDLDVDPEINQKEQKR